MNEDFLHYLWKYRLLKAPMLTTENDAVSVIRPGHSNTDSGPDFSDARIIIGNTEWAGNIEIHIRSSDWFEHRHHLDPAYDSVILHVVYINDQPAYRKNGQLIPTLECVELVNEKLSGRYKQLMSARELIPCSRIVGYCPELVLKSWCERMLIERLERKSAEMNATLQLLRHNWEETFFRFICRTMGLKINSLPFELLATSISLKWIMRHYNQLQTIEALLLGQAGFLEGSFSHQYALDLQKEYRHLKALYRIEPMNRSLWKFMRLRPASFPTLRIAQLAAIVHKTPALFARFLEEEDLEKLETIFDAEPSEFWKTHYSLEGEATKLHSCSMGRDAICTVFINALIPMLFLYGKKHSDDQLVRRAYTLLEKIPAEANAIVKEWLKAGIKVQDAFTSQALIELSNSYCIQKRCLSCRIGVELISSHH